MDEKAQAERAQNLRNGGLSYTKIAAALKISYPTAYALLNPEYKKYRKEYSATHKEEKRVYNAKYRQKHAKQVKNATAEWRREHKLRVKERGAEYYQEHKVRAALRWQVYYQEHKKEIMMRAQRYSHLHQVERTARESKRRGLIAGVTIGNLAEINEIYRKAKEDQKVRCYLCGKLIPMGHRHVDHIIPITKGGAHRPSNLAVACDTCNQHKYNKTPEEIGILL
jgi:5-methylcytosine-specific restriction endonuclease McrA